LRSFPFRTLKSFRTSIAWVGRRDGKQSGGAGGANRPAAPSAAADATWPAPLNELAGYDRLMFDAITEHVGLARGNDVISSLISLLDIAFPPSPCTWFLSAKAAYAAVTAHGAQPAMSATF
jgi:hypothetical protein